jgi:hypothetical protein
LVVFVLVMIWVLPRLWRGIKGVFGWLRRKLGGRAPKPAEPATDQPSVDTTEQPPDTPEPSVNTTDQPPDTVEPSVNTTDRPAS